MEHLVCVRELHFSQHRLSLQARVPERDWGGRFQKFIVFLFTLTQIRRHCLLEYGKGLISDFSRVQDISNNRLSVSIQYRQDGRSKISLKVYWPTYLFLFSPVRTVHSREFVYVFCFVPCKTSQNVISWHFRSYLHQVNSKFQNNCNYGAELSQLYASFFLISLDETTSQL